jgi:UDP-N-acetylmuramoyl-L-alanyl-D-glutamate--2,6-diaminopimelate ligase
MAKKLEYIIRGIPATVHGSADIMINNLVFDSRKVKQGDLFVAVKGTHVDGHEFITGAIKDGASAILCEGLPEKPEKNITYILTDDSASSLAWPPLIFTIILQVN